MVRLNAFLLQRRRTFIDSVRISVHGGRGGNGLPKYGGIGGKGGDVYLEASDSCTLSELKRCVPTKRFIGGPGENSRRFQILGNPGKDVVIKCPPGITAVGNNYVFGELNKEGEKLLLTKGGSGGGPHNGFIGQKGQHFPLTLDLKLLADVGFVGYPNAGKSTLLKALSNANPKIASYPFTTIAPNIGILKYEDFRQISAADLPGLIEGAHINFGMGHKFLKHCMRTKILLFVIDINGFCLNPNRPHRNAFETIMYLNKELELYDEELLLKPMLLAVNKIDTDSDEMKFKKLKEDLKLCATNTNHLPNDLKPKSLVKFDAIVPISAKDGTNISLLKDKIRKVIDIYHANKVVKYMDNASFSSSDDDGVNIIYA